MNEKERKITLSRKNTQNKHTLIHTHTRSQPQISI